MNAALLAVSAALSGGLLGLGLVLLWGRCGVRVGLAWLGGVVLGGTLTAVVLTAPATRGLALLAFGGGVGLGGVWHLWQVHRARQQAHAMARAMRARLATMPPPAASDAPPAELPEGARAALQGARLQLDAVVWELERAAGTITMLASRAQDDVDNPRALSRLDKIVAACAFHDLCGQRLARTHRLLRHLEQHGVTDLEADAFGLASPLGAGWSPDGMGMTQEEVDTLIGPMGGRPPHSAS